MWEGIFQFRAGLNAVDVQAIDRGPNRARARQRGTLIGSNVRPAPASFLRCHTSRFSGYILNDQAAPPGDILDELIRITVWNLLATI
jgi:hypothetical protein